MSTPIVASSIEGQSGFINHSLTSADPAYNGIFADGVRLGVAGQRSGKVLVTESGGGTTVLEDGALGADRDTYSIRLAVPAPAQATLATLTVSAALAPDKDASQGGKSVEVSTDGVHFSRSLVLSFDSSAAAGSAAAWAREQTIYVRADHDDVAEGERTVIISHSIQSANPDFNRLGIANVEAKVIDDDRPGLIIQQTGNGTQVLE